MDATDKARIRAINESMHDEIMAVLQRVQNAGSYEEARDLMIALHVDIDKLPSELGDAIGDAWSRVFELPRQQEQVVH